VPWWIIAPAFSLLTAISCHIVRVTLSFEETETQFFLGFLELSTADCPLKTREDMVSVQSIVVSAAGIIFGKTASWRKAHIHFVLRKLSG
jgi:hypothetical protein